MSMTPKGFREQFLPLGKVRIITAGDGLWSPSIIRSVNFRLQAGCRIEDGEDSRGWLHGFFKREDWDLPTPMYTDTAVPRGIEIYLRSLGYRVSDGEVCWSEHGAQMDHATDFDISGDLIAQFWPELDEPALRAQFPAVQNALGRLQAARTVLPGSTGGQGMSEPIQNEPMTEDVDNARPRRTSTTTTSVTRQAQPRRPLAQ